MTQEKPWEAYKAIRRELGVYDDDYGSELNNLPEVVVLTKCDLMDDADAAAVAKEFAKKTKTKPLVMSAAGNVGVEAVVERLGALVAEKRQISSGL